MSDWKREAELKRKERAKELALEVKNGTYQPAAFNKEASWFPDRGVIKKDSKAIEQLYGGNHVQTSKPKSS